MLLLSEHPFSSILSAIFDTRNETDVHWLCIFDQINGFTPGCCLTELVKLGKEVSPTLDSLIFPTLTAESCTVSAIPNWPFFFLPSLSLSSLFALRNEHFTHSTRILGLSVLLAFFSFLFLKKASVHNCHIARNHDFTIGLHRLVMTPPYLTSPIPPA